MARRVTALAAPLAHLVGPGKVRVINGQLAFVTGGAGPVRLDPRALQALYCYGPVGVSDEAFQVLFAHNIQVAWMSPGGARCQGRLERADSANTPLRLRQHLALARPEGCLELARRIVAAKIASQRQAARHYQRHGCADASPVLQQLQAASEACEAAGDLGVLRGVEGASSAAWFGLFGRLLQPPWRFPGRVKRPPTDPVNALLSLGYTWLLDAQAQARCEAAGLEVNLGALHDFRPGRPSLACDLMEPLRAPAVDRWLIASCNRAVVREDDFVNTAEGVRLRPERFGTILASWDEQWLHDGHERALDAHVAEFITALRCEKAPTAETEGL